jgi:hypothetical protein
MTDNRPDPIDIDHELQAAADRLLARWHIDNNVELTRAALVRESGVSKATLYRRTDFLVLWESEIAKATRFKHSEPEPRTAESLKALEEENAGLKVSLQESRAGRRAAEQELKTAVSIIVALSRQKPRVVK